MNCRQFHIWETVAFVLLVLFAYEVARSKALQQYKFVGCYNDKGDRGDMNSRPMTKFLSSYRTRKYLIKWTTEEYQNIIRQCAADAERAGYLFFAIQFFGECWSGPKAHMKFSRDGKSNSEICVKDRVGAEWENAVYRLLGQENECESYKKLTEADRNTINPPNFGEKCDHYLKPGWYRFEGDAGDVIATSCPKMGKCGTVAPGWMDGKLPHKVINKSVKRKVYFNAVENCSKSDETFIRARNCGQFFVFYLPRAPRCVLRYCGSNSNHR